MILPKLYISVPEHVQAVQFKEVEDFDQIYYWSKHHEEFENHVLLSDAGQDKTKLSVYTKYYGIYTATLGDWIVRRGLNDYLVLVTKNLSKDIRN